MTASAMLDTIKEKMNLKTDAALCAAIGITPPIISKVRAGTLKVGAALLLRLHELTGMRTREIRAMIE